LNTAAKLKCLELLPWPPAISNGSWGLAFSNFTDSKFEERLAYAKGMGANSIKIVMSGLTQVDFPPAPRFEQNVSVFAGLCRNYDLRIYTAILGPGQLAQDSQANRNAEVLNACRGAAIVQKYAYDLMTGIDLCNEINFHSGVRGWPNDETSVNTAMATDLSYMMSQFRIAVPGVPLTFSVYLNNRTDFASDLMKLQSDLGCDFHDYHPYYRLNTRSDIQPSSVMVGADVAQLEAQSWFIGRHMIGECGILNDNIPASLTAWVNGMAAQAARPKSMGAVYFGDRSYSSDSEPGHYGINGRPVLEAAFKAWPYSQI
jgi:hypothetical protein